MAAVAFTVEKKFEELKMRKEEQRKLGKQIDQMIRQNEDSDDMRPGGCSAGLCAWVLRRWGRPGRVSVATSEGTETRNGSSSIGVHRAVFGLAGAKKGDPAAKLEEAATVMRARIAQLEERVTDERKLALSLQQAGQKTQALRALKKSKAIDKQLEANQASLMAVEQQVDMLAQAAMQKTLTSALASTSKSMRADGKMLGRAEKAIDDASDVRDMAADLNQVMAEFAHSGAGEHDDDDLIAELEAMANQEHPPPPPTDQQVAPDSKAAEIAEIERQIAERQAQLEEARGVRASMLTPPSSSVLKKEEKTALLANNAAGVSV